MNLSEKIKFLRKEYRYTQKKFAEMTGIAFRTLQQYESGDRNPKPDKLDKMADALNIPVQCFLSFVDLTTNHLPLLLSLPINERVKALRLSALYSVPEFAAAIACHIAGTDDIDISANNPDIKRYVNEINGIEAGTIQPTERMLWNIADALNIPDDILTTNAPSDLPTVKQYSQLMDKIKELNADGFLKAVDYINDLSSMPKYRR